jgi:hypothetical protein
MTRASPKDIQRAIDFLARAKDLPLQGAAPPQIDYAHLVALAAAQEIELDAASIEQGFRLMMQARRVAS